MYPGILLAMDGESLFGLIIFAVVVINVIRAVIKGQKQQREQQQEQLRQPPPPRTQPGEQRAGREIEDFLEEISRGKSAPLPPPRPAERPQYQSPQRPVPPVARPLPPTVPYPAGRPTQQPRPQPATMRQPQPQPRRSLDPQPAKPRTIGARSAPTSHPAGYKIAAAPAPAPALHSAQPSKAARYTLEVADSLEVTHTEELASAALLEKLLPKDPLKKAIIMAELIGPCRAQRRLRI